MDYEVIELFPGISETNNEYNFFVIHNYFLQESRYGLYIKYINDIRKCPGRNVAKLSTFTNINLIFNLSL